LKKDSGNRPASAARLWLSTALGIFAVPDFVASWPTTPGASSWPTASDVPIMTGKPGATAPNGSDSLPPSGRAWPHPPD